MTSNDACFYVEFKSKINHDVKKVRVNALNELKKHVSSDLGKLTSTESENYLSLLIKLFKDDAEVCREICVKLVTDYINEQSKIDDETSTAILLQVHDRLGKESVEEPSEEIRLALVKLIISLVCKHDNFSETCVKNIVDLLINCLNDSFSEVKKSAFELTEIVAKKFPASFPEYSMKIVECLLNCCKHKHFRVRASAINCLGVILEYCNKETIRLVCGSLGECLLDSNVHVRISILKSASNWLLTLRDRYSYACYIIPLILSCISDESEECQKEAADLWGKIGLMYLKDNEDKLKEKIEYLPEQDYHVTVPNYGCHALVSEQIARFLPAIIIELDDWRNEVQIRAATLLKTTIVHARHSVIPFLDVLISAFLKKCTDEKETVSKNIIESVEYVGKVVPPNVYWKVVEVHLKNGCTLNHLIVIASLLKFSDELQLGQIIEEIVSIFVQQEISALNESSVQQHLLKIFLKLLNCCLESKLNKEIAYNTCQILLMAMSKADENTQLKTLELIDVLCKVSEFQSLSQLNQYSLTKLYDQFLETCPLWQSYSTDLKLFLVTMSHFSDDVFKIVPEKFVRVCQTVLEPSFDKEVTFKVLLSMGKLIENDKIKLNQNIGLIEEFLLGSLKLQLIWRSGRTVEVIRNAALIIYNLYSERVEKTNLAVIYEFIPLLISLSEDNYEDTRVASLYAFVSTSRLFHRDSSSLGFFLKMLSAAIQRLEDTSNRVRSIACTKIAEMFSYAPNTNQSATEAEIAASLKSIELLFVMLSDENAQIRNGVQDVLKQPSTANFLKQLFSPESLNVLMMKCRDQELALNLKTSLNI